MENRVYKRTKWILFVVVVVVVAVAVVVVVDDVCLCKEEAAILNKVN